jgi:hypothetical protein
MCGAPSHVRFTPNSDTDCVLIVFTPQHRPAAPEFESTHVLSSGVAGTIVSTSTGKWVDAL